ncbi:MAG: methyl-accepting chemotaxis protein, partial [Sterolibacterium sp.]
MNTASSLQRTTLWPIAAAALVASATAAAIWVLAPPAGWSACLVLAGAAVAVAAHWVSRQTLHRRLGGDWDDFERLGGDDSSYRRAPEGSLVSILGAKLLQQHGSEAAVKGDVAAIATGVGKLSAQTTQLALSLQIQGNTNRESRDSVHHIDQSIQVVAALARETEGDARQVSDLSLEGEERVNQAAGRMQSIAGAVQESSQQVGQLVEGVEQIGGIANIIKEIAGQTNLLALNAAIEAARAGEQGRGFAVVADEVRKLAERTAKATGEIGTLIARIQADTQAAVEQMEQVTPIIQGGLEQAESAATVLRSIKQQAAGTLEKMGNLSQALAEQSVQATEMVN